MRRSVNGALLGFLWCSAVTMAGVTSTAETILPERISQVKLSNIDMNRIVCDEGNVEYAKTSEEKGVRVEMEGKDAYVKYEFLGDGTTTQYVTMRTELYITCAGQVYTLMITPDQIPGQTIHLGIGRAGAMGKNIALLGPLPLEKRALFLIESGVREDYPDSFNVTEAAGFPELQWYQGVVMSKDGSAKEVEVAKARTITVEGVGMTLKEYWLRTNRGTGVALEETDFLNTFFGENIFAITLDSPSIRPSKISRVFVVERDGR